MDDIPRPEYPRPTLERDEWLNLNGRWAFCQDPSDRGLVERWHLKNDFTQSIIVPYPVEAEASGIHDVAPASVVWYERRFEVPGTWSRERVLLRIGACDHWTRIFVNGQEVGQHRGGYSPIACDIAHALEPGENRVTIRVEDCLSWTQPRGKQAGTSKWPIDYDAVTGIWQTAWLEPVPSVCIEEIYPEFNIDDDCCIVQVGLSGMYRGSVLVSFLEEGVVIASGEADTNDRPELRVRVEIPGARRWSPASPYLYELVLVLKDDAGREVERVKSYAGLRDVRVEDGKLLVNREPIYLRGVLDQGYFPEGWYTPVDDAAIRNDVALTLALGFNCARKHQKAEDPRYLYWADKLGLLVWAEMPSGRIFSTELVTTLTEEWMQLVRRDRGHPCIVTWVPFNESWGVWNQAARPAQRAFVDAMVHLTHALDPSRPVVGNDGWEYSSGDLWTLHLYEGEPGTLADRLETVLNVPSAPVTQATSAVSARTGALAGADVSGLPVLLTECGGVGYVTRKTGDEFAYGDLPETVDALETRIRNIARDVHNAGRLQGFVWTQLTDVQQEINGVLYFDRSPKLPLAIFKEIFEGIGDA